MPKVLISHSHKDEELAKSLLENVFNSIQKHKRIESGYAYWGIGPAVNWKAACDDQLYHMQRNIQLFPATIENFCEYFKKREI